MALKYVRRMTRELQLLASSLSPQWSPPQDRNTYSAYEYCASTVTGFSHAIEFIFLISETSSSCRELLLEMGSMHTIATAIPCAWPKFVSNSIHHHPTQEIPRIELAERKRLMRACFRYVNFVLYHANDSISALDEALKAGLLESINRAINIPRHNDDTEKPLMKPALETLSILPRFFGSLTIMKRLQHHQEIMRIHPGPHYPDPLIKNRWRMVVDTALPLLALQLKSYSRHDFDASTHPNYRCSACTVAHYCSKRCQVADWKNHTNWCGPLRAALGCLDSHDMRRSLPWLATLEDFYCISAKQAIKKLTLTARKQHPDSDLVLQIDTTVFPVAFEVITAQTAFQLGILRGVSPVLVRTLTMVENSDRPAIKILRLKYGQNCWNLFSPTTALQGGFDWGYLTPWD
ncbi:uncharacterized protein EDB91DRAFT_210698 [Suillus paluster]|uniref:uncharacterized protein n=1 Tax=Suillus paluster TaxID=48578 RepID=UPI001B877F18|nr:uncharacterized protein EDB91DRAFT_210698 [Suillus paluster]KAG1744116.1 hypothetical protein EDB91DRAFT_210698 [Suillus paluster]